MDSQNTETGTGTVPGGELAPDNQRQARIARADRYLKEDLRDQRGWYSNKAAINKAWAQRLGLIIIAAGALTTFLQIFGAELWVRLVAGILGVIVVLAQGVQRIWRFDETWRGYRIGSERMKREWRLYLNGAGEYAALADEDEAYRHFVEAIEQIIAEEQQIYWEKRGKPVLTDRASTPP